MQKKYDIVIGIRKFSIGKRARTDKSQGGQPYKWQFLTNKEDKILNKHIEANPAMNSKWILIYILLVLGCSVLI